MVEVMGKGKGVPKGAFLLGKIEGGRRGRIHRLIGTVDEGCHLGRGRF
jgi:hypothetical protein